MLDRRIAGGIAVVALAGAAAVLAGARTAPAVERTDFGVVRTPIAPSYRAVIEPASKAPVKEFRIPVSHEVIEIAPGVKYDGWTFGGTVPGPTIRVREGDLVKVTLVNESDTPHSIDFHSARIAMDKAFGTIMPGEEISFEFEAKDPGAYLVHCGTPPVLMHIMQGMYMAIIVDPKEGWGTKADREFVLVQSEFYAKADEHGMHGPDWSAALAKNASHVVFNGRAFQYKDEPLVADVGDRVRLFVVNAGPSIPSDFHVVGTIFDRVYPDGNPRNALESVQTYTVPAGGGAVFETVFEADSNGEGVYAFVTHAFADATKGAVGLIKVGHPVVAGVAH
jgi:nitrite reductase (NO-forming)